MPPKRESEGIASASSHPSVRVGQGCKTLDFVLFVTFSLKKEKVRGRAPGSAMKSEKP